MQVCAIVKFIQETGPWEEMKAVVLPVRASWTGSRFLFLVYPNLRLLLASGGLHGQCCAYLEMCLQGSEGVGGTRP